jgi:hypothetical protein
MSVTVVATSMRGRHYPPLSKNHAYRRRGIVIDCQAALACRSTLPDDATRDEAFNARRWLIAALVLVLIIGAGYVAFCRMDRRRLPRQRRRDRRLSDARQPVRLVLRSDQLRHRRRLDSVSSLY